MAQNNTLASYRIVIVDDSDFARAQIGEILKTGGFTVSGEASNGAEALQVIRDKKPHLVIADVVMPDMSGTELAENIVSNYPHTVVVMISSLQHEQIILEAIRAGAVDFIAKPVNPRQLLETVEKCLISMNKD